MLSWQAAITVMVEPQRRRCYMNTGHFSANQWSSCPKSLKPRFSSGADHRTDRPLFFGRCGKTEIIGELGSNGLRGRERKGNQDEVCSSKHLTPPHPRAFGISCRRRLYANKVVLLWLSANPQVGFSSLAGDRRAETSNRPSLTIQKSPKLAVLMS